MIKRTRFWMGVVSLMFWVSPVVSAATLVPAEYEDFINPMAGNAGDPDNIGVQTVVAGSVAIEPLRPGGTRGGFGFGLPTQPLFTTSPFPRDGEGFISFNGGNIPSLDRDSIVLTFSQPVAGFGATFSHRTVTFLGQPTGVSQPSTITLFDGIEGTGSLLGQVQSSGLVGDAFATADFVGLLSDQANIRSAVITGPGPFHGFAVDAYAVTLTPVPEPGSAVVFLVLALGLTRRR